MVARRIVLLLLKSACRRWKWELLLNRVVSLYVGVIYGYAHSIHGGTRNSGSTIELRGIV